MGKTAQANAPGYQKHLARQAVRRGQMMSEKELEMARSNKRKGIKNAANEGADGEGEAMEEDGEEEMEEEEEEEKKIEVVEGPDWLPPLFPLVVSALSPSSFAASLKPSAFRVETIAGREAPVCTVSGKIQREKTAKEGTAALKEGGMKVFEERVGAEVFKAKSSLLTQTFVSDRTLSFLAHSYNLYDGHRPARTLRQSLGANLFRTAVSAIPAGAERDAFFASLFGNEVVPQAELELLLKGELKKDKSVKSVKGKAKRTTPSVLRKGAREKKKSRFEL